MYNHKIHNQLFIMDHSEFDFIPFKSHETRKPIPTIYHIFNYLFNYSKKQ